MIETRPHTRLPQSRVDRGSMKKNAKKQSVMDQLTNQLTDMASHRVECTLLKRSPTSQCDLTLSLSILTLALEMSDIWRDRWMEGHTDNSTSRHPKKRLVWYVEAEKCQKMWFFSVMVKWMAYQMDRQMDWKTDWTTWQTLLKSCVSDRRI